MARLYLFRLKLSRGLGFQRERLDFTIDRGPNLLGHAIDEQRAFEVIGFMLNTTAEQIVADESMLDAVFILKLYGNLVGARDIAANIGKGEAAFFEDVLIGILVDGDLRVGDDHGHEEIERGLRAIELPIEIDVTLAKIYCAQLEGATDLLGGEADAVRVMHRVDHGG